MGGSIPASTTADGIADRRATGGTPRTSTWRMGRNSAALTGLALSVALVCIAVLAGRLAPDDPFQSVAAPLAPPSLGYPMGTDDLGRNVLSGVIHGARTSLAV